MFFCPFYILVTLFSRGYGGVEYSVHKKGSFAPHLYLFWCMWIIYTVYKRSVQSIFNARTVLWVFIAVLRNGWTNWSGFLHPIDGWEDIMSEGIRKYKANLCAVHCIRKDIMIEVSILCRFSVLECTSPNACGFEKW